MPNSPKLTVMQVFHQTATRHADRPALKVKRGGSWQTTTWAQYEAQTRQAAKALIHLGMPAQQGVSIIGYNSPEWAVADMAAIYAGGFPAGIYTTNSPPQCQYIAEHSDSHVVFVEDQEQLAKFLEIRDELPLLKAIVLMNPGEDHADDKVYSWKDFMALGDQVSDEQLQERIDAQGADDVCTFIYTSGTTGNPKAVMITHDNITWTAKKAMDAINGHAPVEEERVISYLPFSHIAEQVISMHTPMVVGGCTYFAESIEKLGDNLREVRPTMFLAVPRVWEKIQAKIIAGAAQNSGLKKKIGAWAKGVGLRTGYAMQEGGSPGLSYKIADKLVFSKVKALLGLDQCRVQITSAAPISKDTLEFFLSLGLPIMEVYGMSECTGPATLSLPDRYKTASVGWAFDGAEVKIADDGEICMRGRHVSKGYYKNPESTAETIDADGWLHSGDLGDLRDGGFLYITGRKKELIITAGGENIAPNVIEGLMKGIPGVSQVVVVGDRRKHLSALFTLDAEKLDIVRQHTGCSGSMPELAGNPKVQEWLMGQVNEKNKELARVQTVKKIKILDEDLSIDNGMLTPTMKVKRKVVNERFADEIEAFYS